MTSASRATAALLAAVASIAASGCGSIRDSTTKRGAQELLAVSTAAQRAVLKLDLRPLAGKKVFVDGAPIQTVDRLYVVDALQQAVVQAGASLAPKAEEAEVVLEARMGALAINDKRFALELPLPPMPDELAGELPAGTPTSVGISYQLQEGWAKLKCFALDQATGRMIGRWSAVWGYGYASTFSDDLWPAATLGEKLERDYAQ